MHAQNGVEINDELLHDFYGMKSMIYSDDWGIYRNLEDIGYEHEIVNHRVEFVNEKVAHTNTIEGFLGRLESRF